MFSLDWTVHAVLGKTLSGVVVARIIKSISLASILADLIASSDAS